MIKIPSQLIGLSALFCASFGVYAQDKLDIAQAIEMALAHDPRIEEKEAFVRKARGLLGCCRKPKAGTDYVTR
jgi:hypothetical protein